MHKDFPAIAMKVMTDTLAQFPLPAFLSASELEAVCETEDHAVIGSTMDALEAMDYLYVTTTCRESDEETLWITRLTEKGLRFVYAGDTPLNALLTRRA